MEIQNQRYHISNFIPENSSLNKMTYLNVFLIKIISSCLKMYLIAYMHIYEYANESLPPLNHTSLDLIKFHSEVNALQ